MRFLKQQPLAFFLMMHFFVWSLVPLLRDSLPMDSIEAIVWGKYCDWGTNKHPPFSGFLAYWFYSLGANFHYAIYALSQCCVLVGFIYIYKLACWFMTRENAVLAVMLLEGVIYYGFSALEFNVNVVSLALWPLTAYYFYKALVKDKAIDWVLLGLFAGLNLFNKYVSGILLLAMLLFMFFDPIARHKFKKNGPYLAALVCVLIITPHLCWLYQHNFFVVDYFLGRSDDAGFDKMPILRHIIYPIMFFGAQLLFGLGAILIYFIGTKNAAKTASKTKPFERNFMWFMGVLPLILMVAISLIGGIKLKSMWGFPVMYMLGILLFEFFPRQMTATVHRRIVSGVYLMMALLTVSQMCVITFNKSDKMHLNALQYGKNMEKIWQDKTEGRPFKYVAGDVWWVGNVALYAPSQPKPIIWGDVKKNPWFDEADFAASGALLVASDKREYAKMVKILGQVTEAQALEMEFENLSGKIRRKTIYYGFYNL